MLAAVVAGAGSAACDEVFRPTAPGELSYSVFGYLDAAADTQWIRVMPVRPLVIEPPSPLPARVTLEHLGTGRIVELRDSVFQFDRVAPDLQSEGLFVHNFWTAERIEPGASYRFAIHGEDGRSAESVIRLPPPFEVEVWRRQSPGQVDLLHVVGAKFVALIGTSTYLTDRCGLAVQRDSYTFTAVDSAFHRMPLFQPLESRGPCEPVIGAGRRELWVAASGEKWPTGADYLSRALKVSDELSNISRSVGFLGGVLIRRVPSEACQIVMPFGTSPVHCVLRYDASTAVLSGTVEDARCGGPVQGATIQLREIVQPAAPYKLRPTSTDSLGRYEIAALEAGRRYALSVRRVVAGVDLFEEYGDTLEFAPGQRATRDIELRRIERCAA